ARLDTHYLLALREKQAADLFAAGADVEAQEEFDRLARLGGDPEKGPDPAAFWRVKGARELGPGQSAVLRELFAYREQQAERADLPLFKVLAEATLLELARHAPRQAADLAAIPGMTPEQIRRHGDGLLRAIEAGLR